MAGERLAQVKSTSSFWFGWKDWYPETMAYGSDGGGQRHPALMLGLMTKMTKMVLLRKLSNRA
jgi:hypothetical protein